MQKNKIYLYIILQILFVCNMSSQVTIGSVVKPVTGALLDLREYEQPDVNNANSTKGIMIPRVFLTDVNNLYPMFKTGYDKTEEDHNHVGLLVMNVNENLPDGSGKGLYVWNDKWVSLKSQKASVTVSVSQLTLTGNSPVKSFTLTVSPENANFNINTIGPNASSYTKTSLGGGKYRIDVTRSSTTFGKQTYEFSIDGTVEKAEVVVDNLNLNIPDVTLRLGNDLGSSYSSNTLIKAEGGDEDWVVLSYTNNGTLVWDKPPTNNNGTFEFKLKNSSTNNDIKGEIVIAHKSDLSIQKTIKIVQNRLYIKLPDYDFMIVRYTFKFGHNLDTFTEIDNTDNLDIDGKAMSPKATSQIEIFQDLKIPVPGQALPVNIMRFGGEKVVNSQPYEETLIYSSYLNDYVLGANSPRVYNINMYATWWNLYIKDDPTQNKVNIDIILYKGGYMEVTAADDFVNKGGTKVYSSTLLTGYSVTTERANSKGEVGYKTGATKLGHMEYDWIDGSCVYIPPK